MKIGAVLTTPGNWPGGIVADGDSDTWNRPVLSIDFAVLHWYPGGSGTADALAKPVTGPAVGSADVTNTGTEAVPRVDAGVHVPTAVGELRQRVERDLVGGRGVGDGDERGLER